MKKIMLIGKTGCGKTTLIQRLKGEEIKYRKTQSLQYHEDILDTPGEYLENRRFHNILSNLSFKYDIVFLVQSSVDVMNLFPPNFSKNFNGRKVFGIVTKMDLKENKSDLAEKFLLSAGAEKIFKISSKKNIGLDSLRHIIEIRED